MRAVVLALASWAALASLASASPSRRFSASSSAVVTIKKDDSSFFGASAFDDDWGAKPPPQKVSRGARTFVPLFYTTPSLSDPFGCTPPEQLRNASPAFELPAPTGSFALLVDRGRCAFSLKALYAKQLGAVALLVTDTQQQAYNRSIQPDATPEARAMEFSCANGNADVDARDAATLRDPSSDKWLAAANALRCTASASCDSSKCIPSGKNDRQVCCLWDVADPIGFSNSSNGVNISRDDVASMLVVRLRIADGDELKRLIANASEELLVTIYQRGTPMADPSQFIIWLLAIVTVMIGGYKGATIERERALRKQSAMLAEQTRVESNDSVLDESVRTGPTAIQDPARHDDDDRMLEDETMDLNMYHAAGFVCFATVFLLVLFYWNVVLVVIIFFAIGSVSCSYFILWQPLFSRVSFLRVKPFAQNPPTNAILAYLEPETWMVADVFAFFWSVAVSSLWFICRNRQYAWLLQDVFGICLCILFLRTIRLPNLKVATFMLVLVFLYDIFMVFISGYIFSKSLMISAATGGSQSESSVGDDYCMRYPTDTEHKCVKESMPILLRFPKVIDWRAGQSMLGLGDIVLPGLLVVFCARFDYATRGQLLGRVKAPHLARLKSSHQLNALAAREEAQHPTMAELSTQSAPTPSRRGLFGIVMWGYAIGLLLANIGVMVMKEGQPALMYIVPCTLGLLWLVAWRRGILKKLWDGPEEFRGPYSGGSEPQSRSVTLREQPDDNLVVISSDTTPLSTYSRPGDTPKHGHQSLS